MVVAGTTWRCAGLVGLVGVAVCLPPASHAAESKAAADADESPLTRVLVDPDHAESVKMPAEDRLRLTIWLDGNAPFYGAYSGPERVAQLRGESIPPPAME
jgi:Flp pilus assembly protein CpaB